MIYADAEVTASLSETLKFNSTCDIVSASKVLFVRLIVQSADTGGKLLFTFIRNARFYMQVFVISPPLCRENICSSRQFS